MSPSNVASEGWCSREVFQRKDSLSILLTEHIGCAYTFNHFKTCQKIKSNLQLKFTQKYFPRTPPPTCNIWRGHIDLLESLLKICKSHSLSKLYTVKKQRLQKNEFKRTNYYTILKWQNLNFKAYFIFKIT